MSKKQFGGKDQTGFRYLVKTIRLIYDIQNGNTATVEL